MRPFEGARELIVELRERGHPPVLASSAKAEDTEHYVELLDAGDLIEAYTTSADVERDQARARPGRERDAQGGRALGGDGRRLDLGRRGGRARRA